MKSMISALASCTSVEAFEGTVLSAFFGGGEVWGGAAGRNTKNPRLEDQPV